MDRIGHALLDLAELLDRRGHAEARVQAVHEADRIVVAIEWPGERLPKPAQRPHFDDLDGALAAHESFALWLGTRNAEAMEQRRTAQGRELRLVSID